MTSQLSNKVALINKIQAMLALKENTTFEGEAMAAAALIEKMCKEHNIDLNALSTPQVIEEAVLSFKRRKEEFITLLAGVARYYGAEVFSRKKIDGETDILVVGTEGQQIQTKLYFDYICQVMEQECNLAHNAEKVLAQLTGGKMDRAFRKNFCKTYSIMVMKRLEEMKDKEMSKDEKAVKSYMVNLRLGKGRKVSAGRGSGAFAGYNAGKNVSLNRQASGSSTTLALSAGK